MLRSFLYACNRRGADLDRAEIQWPFHKDLPPHLMEDPTLAAVHLSCIFTIYIYFPQREARQGRFLPSHYARPPAYVPSLPHYHIVFFPEERLYFPCFLKDHVPVLLSWVKCLRCSRWLNSTQSRGALHLLTCRRCPTCRKQLSADGEDHECSLTQVEKRDVMQGRHKYPPVKAPQYDFSWDVRLNVWAADIETFQDHSRGSTHQPYAVAYSPLDHSVEPTIFYGLDSVDKFVSLILSYDSDEVLYIYFWNGGRFDLIPIIASLQEKGVTIGEKNVIKQGNCIMSLSFLNDCGREVNFRDAYLVATSSLDVACKSFGVPDDLAKGNFDHSLVYDAASAFHHRREVSLYLRNDVTALRTIVSRMGATVKELYHLDLVHYITASHLAVNAWKMLCAEETSGLVVPSIAEYEEWKGMVRGGRVQPQVPEWISLQDLSTPYDQLEDYCIMLDCNSLYPTAMSRYLYMKGHYRIYDYEALLYRHRDFYIPGADPANPLHWPSCLYYSIFCVDVTCPKDILTPFLPSRDASGAIVYTLDDKVGEIYFGFELLHAIRFLGYQVLRVAREWRWSSPASKAVPIFKRMVDTNYSIRKEYPSGTAQNTMAKILMNGTYGKTVQRPRNRQTAFIPVEEGEELDLRMKKDKEVVVSEVVSDLGLTGWLVTSEKGESKLGHPTYLGASILAHSRVIMSEALLSTGGYRNPLFAFHYTDTDSLVFHRRAVERLPPELLGNELGQFKNDLPMEARILRAIYLAPKTYILIFKRSDNEVYAKVRCKGIPHVGSPIHIPSPYNLDAPHNRELEEMVQKIDENRATNTHRPHTMAIDPRFRAYVTTDMNGNRTVCDHLSYHTFSLALRNEVQSIKCYSATFRIVYASSMGVGMSILPQHLVRTLSSLDSIGWWQKGKRTYVESLNFSVPPGFIH